MWGGKGEQQFVEQILYDGEIYHEPQLCPT